ncbi:hypothetical protein GUJ93_ZPchr0007g5176 [Zizania palustris]|uniref:Rab3GAP catalytic subunit conserved domain-containing protein n=1 Tax=Zizania palustris TaxID=103762 RepID=A0A8J5TD84_ZIZPA|nr:hypothetical protein GUJ93_ZPchr0007g5176 [Zizania palustris]
MHQLPPPAPAPTTTTSLVSRARTAIHSAAARVLTDIKADLRDADGSGGHRAPSSHRASAGRQPDADGAASTGQVTTATAGTPRDEVSEIIPSLDGDSSNIEPDPTSSTKVVIPPASVVRQLVAAIDNGKNFKTMNDMRSHGDQLLKEKGGLTFSVVKSLVRREKEERSSSNFVGDDETQSLMYSLFKLEERFSHNKSQCNSVLLHCTSVSKDLHGAPPGSFTHQIAETIGKISSVHKMAFFWQSVVLELKKLWYSNVESPDREIYAKSSAGDNVLRLGADHPSENLTLLETGEPIYAPTLQEGPIMTAELIKETEELVLRTGSKQRSSWEGSSRRGRLSDRMQTKEGNLWKELWEAAKPIPAVEQAPIYDEDLAVESIFDALEVIEPSKLFEQLLAVIQNLRYQQVYETMEAIVTHPEETLQIMEAPDEKSLDNKTRIKMKLNFIGKDRQPLWKRCSCNLDCMWE